MAEIGEHCIRHRQPMTLCPDDCRVIPPLEVPGQLAGMIIVDPDTGQEFEWFGQTIALSRSDADG